MYFYLGADNAVSSSNMTSHGVGYTYNMPNTPLGTYGYYWNSLFTDGYLHNKVIYDTTKPNGAIFPLYLLFNSGDKIDSADTFKVNGEEIKKQMLEQSANYQGSDKVVGKYAPYLFSSIADTMTEVNIPKDKEFALTNNTISANWWQKLFGMQTVVPDTYNGIKAIFAVQDTDMSNDNAVLSERLYIDKSDCDEFRDYRANAKKAGKTTYLFRYQVSDYISEEATLYFKEEKWYSDNLASKIDTNAYFFTEKLNLDFDIIDLTFTKDGAETVLPVLMSPMDIIPDADPPIDTTSDKDPEWWKIILAVLALIVLLVLLWPILPPIINALIWLISLPFKALAAIFKAIFHKRE